MLIDTHAHLNNEDLYEKRHELVTRAREAGVEKIIIAGYDVTSSVQAVNIAKEISCCYALVGIHPNDANEWENGGKEIIKELTKNEKVIGIGEIGLDYYHNLSSRELQKKTFIGQISLAKELSMPISIHDREAHGDIMEIIKTQEAGISGGVLHCFSGSWEMAKVCLAQGFYLSFAGPITFKNAVKLQEIVRKVPLESLLVETDCPYLTPVPYRGKQNEPSFLKFTAAKVAELKGITIDEVNIAVGENAKKLFKKL